MKLPGNSDKKVVLVSGYPGAGKSTVAGILEEDISNSVHIESGDIVRTKYREEVEDDMDSHSLGEWVDGKVDENESYVAELTLKKASEMDEDIVIISGLREVVAHELAEDIFSSYDSIFVDSKFNVRLERMNNRGREGEDDFTEQDLRERDEREINWGIEDIRDISNHHIENNSSLNSLKKSIYELNLFNNCIV